MLTTEERKELDNLLKQRSALAMEKKSHELELTKIKNEIRVRGRLDRAKYKMCIDGQTKHLREIHYLESQLSKIAVRQRELAELETGRYVKAKAEQSQAPTSTPGVESGEIVDLVLKIAELRDEYRKFSTDRTRVSSMRTSAAEFAQRLEAILEPYKDL